MIRQHAINLNQFATTLKLFSIHVLEKIFQHYGELDKGCFSFSKEEYTDGSSIVLFHYPTDFNEVTALAFAIKIQDVINNKTTLELFTEI